MTQLCFRCAIYRVLHEYRTMSVHRQIFSLRLWKNQWNHNESEMDSFSLETNFIWWRKSHSEHWNLSALNPKYLMPTLSIWSYYAKHRPSMLCGLLTYLTPSSAVFFGLWSIQRRFVLWLSLAWWWYKHTITFHLLLDSFLLEWLVVSGNHSYRDGWRSTP